MRRKNGCIVVVLFILLGIIIFSIYDIERRGAGGSRTSSPGDGRGGIEADEENLNTPRNEEEIQKARREGTLRDGE